MEASRVKLTMIVCLINWKPVSHCKPMTDREVKKAFERQWQICLVRKVIVDQEGEGGH